MEWIDCGLVGCSVRSLEKVSAEWGMGQGAVEVPQPDLLWEAKVLGGLLHRIGGEITIGSGSVGKGLLMTQGEDGPTAGGVWSVAGM